MDPEERKGLRRLTNRRNIPERRERTDGRLCSFALGLVGIRHGR
jgi:hypothetical protein